MCENGLEARALGMGDCNFTHGVTHCSATLRLSAYLLATGSLPRWYSSIPLRRSVTLRRVLLSFVDCTNATTCHRIPTSALRSFSLCLSLSLSLLLLFPFTYLSVIVTSHPPPFFTFRDKPLLYCQPLSDGPELIRIRRWKRFNVKMINYFS